MNKEACQHLGRSLSCSISEFSILFWSVGLSVDAFWGFLISCYPQGFPMGAFGASIRIWVKDNVTGEHPILQISIWILPLLQGKEKGWGGWRGWQRMGCGRSVCKRLFFGGVHKGKIPSVPPDTCTSQPDLSTDLMGEIFPPHCFSAGWKGLGSERLDVQRD